MINQQNNRITAALAAWRGTVREQNRMSWELQPEALDRAFTMRASDDGWLFVEAPLDASVRATAGIFLPEMLLQRNATLPGGAKFGVDAHFNLSVRAEVPLIEDIDPGPRALEALNGVLAGLTGFNNSAPQATAAPSPAAAIDLKTLAGETGWVFTERDDGRVSFDLSSPAGVHAATLHTLDGGCLRVWVPLAELADLATDSRHALAVLFLRAGTVLRFARPAFVADAAGFEVVFATAPAAAELTQALESLAVGVALVAAEAKLLCEEQTAREYLTAGGWLSREETNNNNNTNQRTP